MDDIGIVSHWLLTHLPRPMAITIMSAISILGLVSLIGLTMYVLALTVTLADMFPEACIGTAVFVGAISGMSLVYRSLDEDLPRREKKS